MQNTNNPKNPINELSDEKTKMDIALYYTHNDLEKAKKMVSGDFSDLYVVKAKFSVTSTYGAFIFFYNNEYNSIVNSFVVITHSYLLDELKTRLGWRDFEKELLTQSAQEGEENELTQKMKTDLTLVYTMSFGVNNRADELKKLLEMNDEIALNREIQNFIHDKFGFINIKISVEFEAISSLTMELESKISNKIDMLLLSSEKEKKEDLKSATMPELEEDDDTIDKKDIQLILRGNLVLSPIKGKNINQVGTGDKIKISLSTSTPKALTVAKALNVYDDGKISPITGRIVSIRHLTNGGYKIYAIIAKGIYVKIEEVEEDIKISMEEPDKPETIRSFIPPIFITLIGVFIALIAVVLIFIFKYK